jgi:hypothetical protein
VIAFRRDLPATAESVAGLTIALLAVDAAGLRLTGLTVHAISAPAYSSLAVLAMVLTAAAWARTLPVRSLWLTVAVGAQIFLPLATATTIQDAHRPAAIAGFVFGVQAAAVVGVIAVLRSRAGAPAESATFVEPVEPVESVERTEHVELASAANPIAEPVERIARAEPTGAANPIAVRALNLGAAAAWLIALALALVTSYQPDQFSGLGPAVLGGLAVVALGATVVERRRDDQRRDVSDAFLAVATATALAAAGTFVPHLAEQWRWPMVEGLALAAAVALLLVPRTWRRGPELVVLGTAGTAALSALTAVMQALVVPTGEFQHVWARSWAVTRALKATENVRDLHQGPGARHVWAGTAQTSLLVLGLMATVLVIAVRSHVSWIRFATAPLAVVALLLVPLETSMTVPAAVAWDLVLGTVVLIAAARRLAGRPEPHRDPIGTVGAATGLFFLVHGSLWSLQSAVLTVATVGVLFAVSVLIALFGPSGPPYRLITVTSSAVLFALESATVARYQGATIARTGVVLAAAAAVLIIAGVLAGRRFDAPTVAGVQAVGLLAGLVALGQAHGEAAAVTLVLAVLIGSSAVGLLLGSGVLEPAWAPIFQILVCVETASFLHWSNPGIDGVHRALAVAVVAGVLTVVAPWLRDSAPALLTGPAAYVVALFGVLSFHRPDVTWLALLAGGVAGGVGTTLGYVRKQHPDVVLRASGAVSAALLLASSWVRLADAHVHSVEPYTLPAAALLLAFGHLRRRRDASAPSWPCYGPGLLLALVPTLIQALADTGQVRPALVGVAALVVLLAGARQRLQAPLGIGAAVLAIDALAQLSPYLASAYNAVPRWGLIAAIGALLLGVGATYERRIRDLRLLHRKFAELG